MKKNITPEIMQLIIDNLVEHNNYYYDEIKIIDNVIETKTETETEYLAVTFEAVEDWNYKLFYSLTEPEVYLKKYSYKTN